MKTSEIVLEFLQSQGFRPDVDSDNGNIVFKYQMATYLYINNDEDKDFFQLAMPSICDVTEDNREIMLEAANQVSGNMKVAKACIYGDSVWLMFEVLLDESPEVATIIERALNILQGARHEFYENLK